MRRKLCALVVLAMVSACGPVYPPASATAVPTIGGSVSATRSLPPAHTPTPSPTFLPTLAPTPEMGLDSESAQAAALRPEFASDVHAPVTPTRYAIDVTVRMEPESMQAEIEGLARISYTNPASAPLHDIVLMLWPNNEQYDSSMSVGPALVQGQTVAPKTELGGLAVRLTLPAAIRQGESVDLSVPFKIEASGPVGGRDPKRFGITEGVLLAPTFYPLVPRLIDGKWEEKDAPPGGDTTTSDVAFYAVRITAPRDLTLVATGVESAQTQDQTTQTVTYVSGPVRDFAFSLGPFVHESVVSQGVTIHGWVLPQHQGDLKTMLNLARDQVSVMTGDVGPYPYTELDVIDAPGAFGGIEYPGLVFIGTVGTDNMVIPVVHEVAHQWFYGVVGDDQLEQPWLDEAAATYASVLFLEQQYGSGRATSELSHYRAVVAQSQGSNMPIGLGVGDYPSENAYALYVYWKGALFFDALRQEMGDRAFFDFLKAFYQDYRYKIATSKDFESVAESTCQCNLTSLFNLWVFKGGPMPVP